MIPYGILMTFDHPRTNHSHMSLIELIGVLFLLLAAPIAHAATVQAVARPCLERTITIKEAYRSVLPILAPLIGTMILLDVLLVIALFALVVPCIYFVTCWSLILPVMLVEGRFGINALSRSRALVVGSWWKTLGILVVAGLIGALPAAGLGFVWSFIPVASNLLNAVTQAVTYSFS